MSLHASVLNIISGQAARCATWLLRIGDAHLEEYSFVARGENINACHFHCVVVGDTTSEYVQAGVPFDFKNRQRPRQTMEQFKEGSVWLIRTPGVDPRAKPE